MQALGWTPVDLRLEDNGTDGDRANVLKEYFLGVRLGTIDPDPKLLRFLDLEARTYGLSRGKVISKKESTLIDDPVVDDVLNFAKDLPHQLSADEKATRQRRKGKPRNKVLRKQKEALSD